MTSIPPRDHCPVTCWQCDTADVCGMFWCAKSRTPMHPKALKPVTLDEARPLHAVPLAELKAIR